MSSKFKYLIEQKKQKNFTDMMMDVGMIPNLAAAVIIFMYTFCFAGLPYSEMKLWQVLTMVGYLILVYLFLEVIAAPKTNYIITIDITEGIAKEGREGLSKEERTELIKKLTICPLLIMLEVASWFLMASELFMIYIKLLLKLNNNTFIFTVLISLYGSYEAGVLAYTYAQKLCSKVAYSESKKELDTARIAKEKYFGPDTLKKLILVAVIPFVLGLVLMYIYYLTQYNLNDHDFSKAGIYAKVVLCVIIVINVALTLIPITVMQRKSMKFTDSINTNLEKILEGNFSKENVFISDFEDELSYNYYLVGKNMKLLETIVSAAQDCSHQIQESTKLLNSTASGTFNDAASQSKLIEECVFLMDKKKSSLGDIASDFSDVESYAISTQKRINEDSALVEKNANQMLDISQANIETIVGIKKLSEQIETVWKIIATIEQLAQKTRIIAFNAELEATASGEIGQNFHIVANEIRRLVSQILNSVKEIREGITEIQHFSDNLIISSEGGTEKIREGSEQFAELEEKINELKLSSEVAAESISNIKNITHTQSAAIVQISSTLKNISAHFESLKDTAKRTEDTSSRLNDLASKYTQINESREA